mmetsp:Transcript_6554/g.10182  ORF Transcript_6554/g.10182 Transcript_6554/m.10182 type:complete len:345 (+) Transcript_6554:22-1056(+)
MFRVVGLLALSGVAWCAPPTPPTPAAGSVPCGTNICPYGFECSSKLSCIPKGNTLCERPEGAPPATAGQTQSCKPSESCCWTGSSFDCCEYDETCSVRTTGAVPVFDGTVTTTVSLEALARNDYVMPNGKSLENKPKTCTNDNVLSPVMGVRAIALPLFSFFLIVISMVMVAKNFGVQPMGQRLSALLLMFSSIFLLFSPMWPYAYLCNLTAVFTFAAPEHKLGWLLSWQLLALAIFLNASNLFGFSTSSNFNFLMPSNPNQPNPDASCTTYYGYFSYSAPGPTRPGTRPWETDRTTWGYCSVEWVAGVMFFCFTSAVSLFGSIIFTAIAAGGRTEELKSVGVN